MGKRGPKGDPYRDQRMVRMYKQGTTLQEIGDEYGISRERVRQIINRNNITAKEGGVHVRTQRKCAIEYCKNKQTSKGYCARHYSSFMRYGNATYVDETKLEGCLVPECEYEHRAKGFCHKHYHNFKYYVRIKKLKTTEEYVELKTSS